MILVDGRESPENEKEFGEILARQYFRAGVPRQMFLDKLQEIEHLSAEGKVEALARRMIMENHQFASERNLRIYRSLARPLLRKKGMI